MMTTKFETTEVLLKYPNNIKTKPKIVLSSEIGIINHHQSGSEAQML